MKRNIEGFRSTVVALKKQQVLHTVSECACSFR
jgi:hypothetical protein